MLLGGARPPLGAAYADSVFDAHPAAGSAGRAGERAKLAGAGLGMNRNTADSGLGGAYWFLLLHQVELPGMGQGCGEGSPNFYKKLIQGQSEQVLSPTIPPTPRCPER